MHSLVIDGWPFYIGLGIFVVHLSFYWANQWRKHCNKTMNQPTSRMDVPTTLLMMALYKKVQKMEEESLRYREILSEIYLEMEQLHEPNVTVRPDPPPRDAPLPPIIDSGSSESDETDEPQVIKKKYIVRRN